MTKGVVFLGLGLKLHLVTPYREQGRGDTKKMMPGA